MHIVYYNSPTGIDKADTMGESMIAVNGLTKRYSGNSELSLKGVDLSVSQGDFYGLLGPNGCGKTTLISIMTGLITASSGSVTVKGFNVSNQMRQVKPMTGLIPQDIAMYGSLSIIDNLKFFGRLYGLHGKLLKERIDECLTIAHLTHVTKRPIMNYSGGMQRRANLVIGLIHRPQVIYLDEPTVNVDPQSRNVIFKILKALNASGTTMLYTTHYLEEAQEMCNRVAVMDDGKVITVGSPNELITKSDTAKDLGDVFLELTGHQLRD